MERLREILSSLGSAFVEQRLSHPSYRYIYCSLANRIILSRDLIYDNCSSLRELIPYMSFNPTMFKEQDDEVLYGPYPLVSCLVRMVLRGKS